MVHKNLARLTPPTSPSGPPPSPAPAQGPEASTSLLLSSTTLSPEHHETPKHSLLEAMEPFSAFHFIQTPPPQSSFLSAGLKSAPLVSLAALPFFFLGSIYDNYPFICLISTFPLEWEFWDSRKHVLFMTVYQGFDKYLMNECKKQVIYNLQSQKFVLWKDWLNWQTFSY